MKIRALVLALVFSLFAAAGAQAITYTFNPFDWSGQASDINDLDHTRFYSWSIFGFTLSPDEHVTGATLAFYGIYDYQQEADDRLYIHLADTAPVLPTTVRTRYDVSAGDGKTYDTSLYQGIDNQLGGDNFAGLNTLISPVWSDPVGGLPANDVVYDFAHLGGTVSPTGNIMPGSLSILGQLEAFMRSGSTFGFAIDPDCHYYNTKVEFKVTTSTAVPEPGTLLLLGIGLVGLGLRRRRD